MRRLVLAVAILMLFPGVAAAGGGIDLSACAGYGEGTAITMQDSCFSGTAHFAPSGVAITISNDGRLPHTLTAVDGSFDTGQIGAAESTELVFDEAGIYRVFCTLHGTADGDGMAGVVVVGEAVPTAMAAPLDTSAISEADAAESGELVSKVDAQTSAIRDLSTGQSEIVGALSEVASSQTAAPPEIVIMAEESGTVGVAVMVVAGVAAGLALAALLTVLSLRFTGRSATKLERFEPVVGPGR